MTRAAALAVLLLAAPAAAPAHAGKWADAVAGYRVLEKAGFKGDCKQVAAALQAAADAPHPGDAEFGAGLTYQRCRQPIEAAAAYQRALGKDATHARARANLGRLLLDKGDRAGALIQYEAAVKADPQLAAAYLGRGFARLGDARELREVSRDAQRALAVDARDLGGYVLLALSYLADAPSQARLGVAAYVLAQAGERGKRSAAFQFVRGMVARGQNHLGDAAETLAAAAKLAPSHAGVRLELARTLLLLRRYDDALAPLAEARKLSPQSYPAALMSGVALRGAARFPEAEKMYQAALELDPNGAEALFDLALLWRDFIAPGLAPAESIKRYRDARALFERFARTPLGAGARGIEAEEAVAEIDEMVELLEGVK